MMISFCEVVIFLMASSLVELGLFVNQATSSTTYLSFFKLHKVFDYASIFVDKWMRCNWVSRLLKSVPKERVFDQYVL